MGNDIESLSHIKWKCQYHIHMLVTIPAKMSVSKFMRILKGKSILMISDRFAHLKYKYGNRQVWCKGYYVDTVGKNKKINKLNAQLKELNTIDPLIKVYNRGKNRYTY